MPLINSKSSKEASLRAHCLSFCQKFGFNAKHGADLYIYALKETVNT